MAKNLAVLFVRAGFPFNYDQEQASLLSGLECRDKSRTLQSQAQDADINVIVKRFGVTGVLPQVGRLPVFGDFPENFDFRTALDAVRSAEESFLQVPADIRRRFGDDAGEFVAFCSDPKNLDELRKLGLARPAAPSESDVLAKEVAREVEKDKIRAKSKPDKGAEEAAKK